MNYYVFNDYVNGLWEVRQYIPNRVYRVVKLCKSRLIAEQYIKNIGFNNPKGVKNGL